MSPEKHRRPFSGLHAEEKKAWVSFYARVGKDPVLAAEVITQLEADAELKRLILALYLSCKESIRADQLRQERHRRIARGMRGLAHLLFVVPVRFMSVAWRDGRDIAIASLPEATIAPASQTGGRTPRGTPLVRTRVNGARPSSTPVQ